MELSDMFALVVKKLLESMHNFFITYVSMNCLQSPHMNGFLVVFCFVLFCTEAIFMNV